MFKICSWYFAFFLFLHSTAHAVSVVRSLEQPKPNELEFIFDKELTASDVKVDYFKDIVQLTLNNSSLYPAKILNPENQHIKKIFAYQYSPQVIRCRISVLGDEKDLKNAVKLSFDHKKLKLQILEVVAAKAETKTEIKTETKAEVKAEVKTETKAEAKTTAAGTRTVKATKAAAPAMGVPSLWKPIVTVVLFFGFFGIVGFVLWKLNSSKKERKIANIFGIKKWISKKNKMIEVVASHYLGPKKNIMVVKIKGKLFVLGMTDGSMNLITELSNENEIDSVLEDTDIVAQALGGMTTKKTQSTVAIPTKQNTTTTLATVQASSAYAAASSLPKNEFFSDILSQQTESIKIREKIKAKVQGLKTL